MGPIVSSDKSCQRIFKIELNGLSNFLLDKGNLDGYNKYVITYIHNIYNNLLIGRRRNLMTRDYEHEIDQLKAELEKIKQMIARPGLPHPRKDGVNTDEEVLTVEGRQQLEELRDQLIAYAEEKQVCGAIAYAGTFSSGDEETTRQSVWAMTMATDDLLKLNESRMVEKVLDSVGNGNRLAILLALLKKPRTVNQLMEVLGANTTGQIYHHLKPLVAADIVKDEKGVYAIIPHRVQGIIMLLAGIRDLLDNRYSTGNWNNMAKETRAKRTLGVDKGKVTISPDFDEPLSEFDKE